MGWGRYMFAEANTPSSPSRALATAAMGGWSRSISWIMTVAPRAKPWCAASTPMTAPSPVRHGRSLACHEENERRNNKGVAWRAHLGAGPQSARSLRT